MKKLLTVVVTVGFFAALIGLANAADYVGASKCKMCHKAVYDAWSATGHAKAFDSRTGDNAKPECITCHVTGSDAFPGVQCEACHGAGSEYIKTHKSDKEGAKAQGFVAKPGQDNCNKCHDTKVCKHAPAVKIEDAKASIHKHE